MYRLGLIAACAILGCRRQGGEGATGGNSGGDNALPKKDDRSTTTGSNSASHRERNSGLADDKIESITARKDGSNALAPVHHHPYLRDRSSGSTPVRQVSPNGVPAAGHFPAVRPHVAKSRVKIAAFGDFGSKTEMMRKTMDTYHKKTANPDMVFLLGDNSYSKFARAADFDIFFDYVAKRSAAPHYPILGNYDYTLGVVPQLLDLAKIDSRWILPSTYHFKRFTEVGFSICVWFLDTEHFEGTQAAWLDKSIATEKPSCTWTIVNGHKPGAVQASGITWNRNIAQIQSYLEPMLDKHKIDVYLCGHHHSSQHLMTTTTKRHVFIVGQIMEAHSIDLSYRPPELIWKTTAEPAYLELDISATQIDFAFHSGYQPSDSPPIHTGIINRV